MTDYWDSPDLMFSCFFSRTHEKVGCDCHGFKRDCFYGVSCYLDEEEDSICLFYIGPMVGVRV